MELATNTFSKGLQMDTNPMVLGTDTLTDCLNGTLITMNGNEVILLNDMGNRRVNNAFLPSGYEPVGMKEYGGIIYVAAYNPITNKSQIGSFPSPQRKIDSNEDNEGEFDFSKFSDDNNAIDDAYLGIKVLNSDSFMIPLTGKASLRAGDKFSLYSPNLYGYEDDYTPMEESNHLTANLTNYYNTKEEEKKAKSPKNKKYTISIGILNSLNEFVDITKTLCRWKLKDGNSEIQTYDSSYPEIYKFNDGYFISKEFTNLAFKESINDADFIKNRQKEAINTYAYKLIGPMYAKITYNHIDNFNYNITGIYEDVNIAEDGEEPYYEKLATLWVEGYLTYNCPDKTPDPNSEEELTPGDDNYFTYEEVIPDFNGFDLIANFKRNDEDVFDIIDSVNGETIVELSVYNPATNLYTVKIVKKYTGIKPNREGTSIFDYVIGVNAGDLENNGKSVYIKGLSTKGSLDLSLFGSGALNLNTWQYYVTDDRVILSFSFDAYPKYGERFTDLTFDFFKLGSIEEYEDLESSDYDHYTLVIPEVYNGKLTVEIFFGEERSDTDDEVINDFESGALYRVEISYTSSESTEKITLPDLLELINSYTEVTTFTPNGGRATSYVDDDLEEGEYNTRWLLTTKLFNEFYNDPKIPDFCKVTPGDNIPLSWTNFLEKMNIVLDTFLNIGVTTENEEDKIGGQLVVSNLLDKISYTMKHTTLILFDYGTPEIKVPNETLYPVKITEGENDLEVNDINPSTNFEGPFELDDPWVLATSESNDLVRVTFNDIFMAENKQLSSISKIFDSLGNNLSDVMPQYTAGETNQTQFCGVVVGWDDVNGGSDGHLLDFIAHNKPISHYKNLEGPKDDGIPENGIRITDEWSDKVWKNFKGQFKFRDHLQRIFQEMDSACPGLMFTYLLVTWNSFSKRLTLNWSSGNNWKAHEITNNESDNGYDNYVARVWWRSREGKWAWFMDYYKEGTRDGSTNVIITDEIVSEDSANAVKSNPTVHNLVKLAILEKIENYVYCMYNDSPNNTTLYAAGNDYQKNERYSFDVITNISYKIKTSSEVKVLSLKIGNLHFNILFPESMTKEITTLLNSSEEFLDLIEKYNLTKSNIENVFLYTENDSLKFLISDSEGNPLNPLCVYILKNENLNKSLVKVKNSTNKFYIDTENLNPNGKNLLLYIDGTSGTPTYKYNLTGHSDGDNATSLDFSGIQIVKLPDNE